LSLSFIVVSISDAPNEKSNPLVSPMPEGKFSYLSFFNSFFSLMYLLSSNSVILDSKRLSTLSF
jgi:hypothetical protein